MRWCSQPGCGRAIMVSLKQNNDVSGGSLQWQQRDIRCGCGAFWCFRCGAPAHRPATCAVAAVWRRKVESDARNEPAEPDESTATRRWLREFTKPCPGCHDPIEKNQGCNHMTCSSCHFEFCWVCMDPWSSHGKLCVSVVCNSILRKYLISHNITAHVTGEQSGGFYRCLIVDETVTASRLEELWRRHNDGDHTTAVTMTADEEARLKAGSAERKRHSAHEQALHEAASARVNVYASAATRNRVRSVSMVSSSTASMSVDGGIEKLGEVRIIERHVFVIVGLTYYLCLLRTVRLPSSLRTPGTRSHSRLSSRARFLVGPVHRIQNFFVGCKQRCCTKSRACRISGWMVRWPCSIVHQATKKTAVSARREETHLFSTDFAGLAAAGAAVTAAPTQSQPGLRQ